MHYLIIVKRGGKINMRMNIKPMNYYEAKQISEWIYEEPYSIYSMDGSDECIDELLNGTYFLIPIYLRD